MRQAIFKTHDGDYEVDLDEAFRLSIRLNFNGPQPNAFGAEDASAETFRSGDFVADTTEQGSCNCSSVRLNPHGNGTHTECVGHIVDDRVHIGELARSPMFPATLITVRPEHLGASGEDYYGKSNPDDLVITRSSIHAALGAADTPHSFRQALIIRTDLDGLVDDAADRATARWSGTNPPYPTSEAIDVMLVHDVRHLLIDLPSIDREDDGGTLPNHHAFFGIPPDYTQLPATPSRRTVTEMIQVPEALPDGEYFLDLQVPDFALDAAPSRPFLFPTKEV